MCDIPDPNAVFPNEYKTSCFLKNVINPMLEENKDLLGMTAEINV